MTQATYGKWVADSATAPESSIANVWAKGWAHVMGNEARSKAIAAMRRDAVKAAFNGTDPTKEQREAFLASYKLPDTESPEYIAAVEAAQQSLFDSFMAGTMGEVASRGPSRDPVQAEYDRIVKTEVLDVLRANKLHKGTKHPAADDEFTMGGQVFTFAQLLDRWAAGFDKNPKTGNKSSTPRSDRIRKEAESIIKARAKAAEAAKIADGQDVNADALGF